MDRTSAHWAATTSSATQGGRLPAGVTASVMVPATRHGKGTAVSGHRTAGRSSTGDASAAAGSMRGMSSSWMEREPGA